MAAACPSMAVERAAARKATYFASHPLTALMLTWKSPAALPVRQRKPSQAEKHNCLLRHVMDNLPGHRVLVLVHVRAQLAPLPILVPPLRSSASAP